MIENDYFYRVVLVKVGRGIENGPLPVIVIQNDGSKLTPDATFLRETPTNAHTHTHRQGPLRSDFNIFRHSEMTEYKKRVV